MVVGCLARFAGPSDGIVRRHGSPHEFKPCTALETTVKALSATLVGEKRVPDASLTAFSCNRRPFLLTGGHSDEVHVGELTRRRFS